VLLKISYTYNEVIINKYIAPITFNIVFQKPDLLNFFQINNEASIIRVEIYCNTLRYSSSFLSSFHKIESNPPICKNIKDVTANIKKILRSFEEK
jgi:hypothetical protein